MEINLNIGTPQDLDITLTHALRGVVGDMTPDTVTKVVPVAGKVNHYEVRVVVPHPASDRPGDLRLEIGELY